MYLVFGNCVPLRNRFVRGSKHLFLFSFDELVHPLLFKLHLVLFVDFRLANVLKGLVDIGSHVASEGLLFSDAFKHRVEAVLYLILSAAKYHFGNEGPLIANLFLFQEKVQVFLEGPRILLDVWREEINPALPALFALPLSQLLMLVTQGSVNLVGNLLPLLLTAFINKFAEQLVLLGGPRRLLWELLVFRLPLVMALVVVPAWY